MRRKSKSASTQEVTRAAETKGKSEKPQSASKIEHETEETEETDAPDSTNVLFDLPQRETIKKIYVTGLSEEEYRTLLSRGYQAVDVRTLPRESLEETQEAIESWFQGISEGTIRVTQPQMRALENEAKIHGLMINRIILGVGVVTLLVFGGFLFLLGKAKRPHDNFSVEK